MPQADNLIRDFLLRDVSSAIKSFEIARKIKHRGLKGKAREIFVKQLFQSLLSADFKFGSGVVTDFRGRQASETDVILYCPEIMPARDANEAAGYFPIESCIYSIEVKSQITAREIKDAIRKGQTLEALDTIYFTNHGPVSSRPITLLFAFSSDLKSGPDEEFRRFKSLVDKAGLGRFGVPPIRVLCIVGKGYWFWQRPTSEGAETFRWMRTTASGKYPHSEVLSLAAGMVNSVRAEKLKRYGLPFGYYLLDENPIVNA